jgi:glucose/arabinose dehydrogenase
MRYAAASLATLFAAACAGSATSAQSPPTPTGLSVPSGYAIQTIAHVAGAREIAPLPNGDLLVATTGSTIFIVPAALQPAPATPRVFATIDDAPDAGITYSASQRAIYVATLHGVYRIAYHPGDRRASANPQKVATVRSGPVAPNSDGDIHTTTSVAFAPRARELYVSIGSSCNACVELDPTRAVIERMSPQGSDVARIAERVRNAIAIAVDPQSGDMWVGGAGQDKLPVGHPYEFLDDLSRHAGTADYGWPDCEENHVAYTRGTQCSHTVAPLVEFPAYATLVGAVFYPQSERGSHAFEARYASGIFVTRHGSWHAPGGCYVAPEVDFVPMNGDAPKTPVDWSDPTKQWIPFVTGFQPGCSASSRIGRPTGIAVGGDGSLFIADDRSGSIYRVRPR